MSSIRTLIGYIAQASRYELLCDGDACLVVGSKPKLKAYLASNVQTRDVGYALKKAWFDDILTGLRMEAAYAFDEEAYYRFYPLAQRAGLTVGPEDFSTPPPPGLIHTPIHLVRVQCVLPTSGRYQG
jgi:hypothetical protein